MNTGLEHLHGKLVEVTFDSTQMLYWEETELTSILVNDIPITFTWPYQDHNYSLDKTRRFISHGPERCVLLDSEHGILQRSTVARSVLFLKALSPEVGPVSWALFSRGSREDWRTYVKVTELVENTGE